MKPTGVIVCPWCGKVFPPKNIQQKFCTASCGKKYHNPPPTTTDDGEEIPKGTTGAISELIVAADLMKKGWSVFRALSPHCFCDLVAFKGKECRFLEVRTGHKSRDGGIHWGKRLHGPATEIAVYVRNTGEIIYIKMEAL